MPKNTVENKITKQNIKPNNIKNTTHTSKKDNKSENNDLTKSSYNDININGKKVVNNTKAVKSSSSNKVKKNKGSKNSRLNKKSSNSKKRSNIIEYYDLPYRYNQTTVIILYQTPTTLFIYWDISDQDREKYINQFGEDFFKNTKPVLVIHNETMNYSFEIDINDYANSWYIHIDDSNCKYIVEFGRRPINNNINIENNYLYITSSNKIETPNNHVLFDKEQKMVYFKNVKTNAITSKNISNLELITNAGKIYNIHNLYKELYQDENIDDLNNPSSTF